ncbi:hypothetical protein F0342_00485 [Bacillus sp. CH30_1T]|uniref:hypothetical protein n=1 Tax=Bacillus sp. CH30_1T TaxID=2604836 RepID=UPI0011ECF38D|nr:hypothetical protein [Bacillus sp. CH30_1T]KAA0566566.1 hypothetical protein F0342_00485 [Bacillus sp. CH30_1T]
MEELVFKNGKTFSNINHIAFNGISADKKTLEFSPCVHASVWALINVIEGVACSAICGYVFAYACS